MNGPTLVFAIVFAVAGGTLGFFLARSIRRRRETAGARKRAAEPVVYASRQAARKAQREREKAERRS